MKPYLDKATNKWKWGTRGEAIYDTKEQCSREGMQRIAERIKALRDSLNNALINHGK